MPPLGRHCLLLFFLLFSLLLNQEVSSGVLWRKIARKAQLKMQAQPTGGDWPSAGGLIECLEEDNLWCFPLKNSHNFSSFCHEREEEELTKTDHVGESCLEKKMFGRIIDRKCLGGERVNERWGPKRYLSLQPAYLPDAGVNHWTSNLVSFLSEALDLYRLPVLLNGPLDRPHLVSRVSHELLPQKRKKEKKIQYQWSDFYDLSKIIATFRLRSEKRTLCFPFSVHEIHEKKKKWSINVGLNMTKKGNEQSFLSLKIAQSSGNRSTLLRPFLPSSSRSSPPPFHLRLPPSKDIEQIRTKVMNELREGEKCSVVASLHLRYNRSTQCRDELTPSSLYSSLSDILPVKACIFLHSDKRTPNILSSLLKTKFALYTTHDPPFSTHFSSITDNNILFSHEESFDSLCDVVFVTRKAKFLHIKDAHSGPPFPNRKIALTNC